MWVRIYINFILPWRQQTQNTQTYKTQKETENTHATKPKRRGEHSPVMLYFVNNIRKSYLPNTSKRVSS